SRSSSSATGSRGAGSRTTRSARSPKRRGETLPQETVCNGPVLVPGTESCLQQPRPAVIVLQSARSAALYCLFGPWPRAWHRDWSGSAGFSAQDELAQQLVEGGAQPLHRVARARQDGVLRV